MNEYIPEILREGELDLGLPPGGSRRKPTELEKTEAEAELVEHQKIVDYDTKEYPVEVLVEKYLTGKDEEQNEIFVPDYQRDFTWTEDRQSKFIESVLIGLPIQERRKSKTISGSSYHLLRVKLLSRRFHRVKMRWLKRTAKLWPKP